MGHMRHHAIIVTTYAREKIEAAHVEARRIFPYVTDIAESVINSWFSFLVPPDGSKEGWTASDQGDERRAAFVAWLEAQRFEDGSQPFKWVEVSFGEDNDRPDSIADGSNGRDDAAFERVKGWEDRKWGAKP